MSEFRKGGAAARPAFPVSARQEVRGPSRNVGVLVVGQVEVAKPGEGQQDDETADASRPLVDRAVPEGRPVRALVLQREQEREENSVNGNQQGPRWDPDVDECAGDHDRAGMARQVKEPSCV